MAADSDTKSDSTAIPGGAFDSRISGLRQIDSRIRPMPRDGRQEFDDERTKKRPRVSGYAPKDWSPDREQATKAVAELCRCNPSEVDAVIDRLLRVGDISVEILAQRFPGPLWITRAQVQEELPAADDISAIAYALTRFEDHAVSVVYDLLSNPRHDVRYYAALMCRDLRDGRLVAPLAAIALEDDRECRRIGIHMLTSYIDARAFDAAALRFRRLSADANVPVDLRKRAISVLTQLRETGCVPLLVDLLASPEPGVRKAARIALRVLTAHDFGFTRRPWLRWLQQHGGENRPGWLIEGLGDTRDQVRLLAASELWRATRMFPPPAPGGATPAFYAKLQSEYRTWWTNQDRHL